MIRAIETGEFTRLGSTEVRRSDFRLVAATNRPWAELQERLDLDFLDRVSYFVLEVPPLRETPEDLPMLWEEVFSEALSKAAAPEAVREATAPYLSTIAEQFHGHCLPGNFRDLFRLAYHVIAYLQQSPKRPEDAIQRALTDSLGSRAPRHMATGIPGLLEACGRGHPLDISKLPAGKVLTHTALNMLRRYMADELHRLARAAGPEVRASDMCDVTERTLQKWRRLEF